MPSSTVSELQELRDFLVRGVHNIHPHATECLVGTRARILADVASKIDDSNGRNIISILGASGCGKSSISLTTKSRLHRQRRLITYFTFDHKEPATLAALWRHVAHDLAHQFPMIRTTVLQQLRGKGVNLNEPLEVFTSLVENPLSNPAVTVKYPLVIIIDGLDECGGRADLRQILTQWSRLPSQLKLLITSRDEGDIIQILDSISISINVPSGNFVRDNPQAETSIDALNDIHTFLEYRFQTIRGYLPSLPSDWPGSETIVYMARHAEGSFSWAVSTTDYILGGIDPEARLNKTMNHTSEPESMKPLDSLYTTILEFAFKDIGVDHETLRSVLGVVVLAKRPFHDAEFTQLPTALPLTPRTLHTIRVRLSSVIAPGPSLRFVHKSFDNFLLSEACPSIYRVQVEKIQYLLTELCLKTMTTNLHFNMCGLETSFLKNTDVPDIETKIVNNIPPLLSYSCLFLAHHLCRTPFNALLMHEVKEMVWDKLLYWFEAMSLLAEINQVSVSLLSVLKWLDLSPDDEFKEFLHDARQFIGEFGQAIAQSAPHIYISALPFAPENSYVARHFLPQFPYTLTLSTGKSPDWSPCIFTSEHHKGPVTSVALSRDEIYLVSGSSDNTVCIRHSHTGNLIRGPLKGASPVSRVFFDPDGRRVWAAFSKGDVVGWDVESGERLITLEAVGDAFGSCHFNDDVRIVSLFKEQATSALVLWNINAGTKVYEFPIDNSTTLVSLSPNGRYVAYAGRSDRFVRILKLVDRDGFQEISYRRGTGKHGISALSFVGDGNSVVSGSSDGTIRIWDVQTGKPDADPLFTAEGQVDAVVFSTRTDLLGYVCEDSAVVAWNDLTRNRVPTPPMPLDGHTSKINHILLTRNGATALTASHDGTVRSWDLRRRRKKDVYTQQGHTAAVRCITFSPCGNKLGSLDDKTIRVWDANPGEPLMVKFIKNRSKDPARPAKLMFSPEGIYVIALNTCTATVQMWNANTGEEIGLGRDLSHDMDDGQKHLIEHVSFRLTDGRIVTCFKHGVVRVWRLGAHAITEDLSASSPQPVDAKEPVKILALSPDGLTAIVRDNKRSPRHYLWSTTTGEPLPITFADDNSVSGRSLEFSPSGQFLAVFDSVSTIQVWNARTGKPVAGPSKLNGSIDRLAFSCNNCHIAFHCSGSGGFTIWDARLASGPWITHAEGVDSLAFSPDGKRLASGSRDGQIRIWDIAKILGDSHFADGFSAPGTRMEDGWVVDAYGQLLFWVPIDRRKGLFWSGNIAVTGGGGILTELDLKNFKFGENWVQVVASTGELEAENDQNKETKNTQLLHPDSAPTPNSTNNQGARLLQTLRDAQNRNGQERAPKEGFLKELTQLRDKTQLESDDKALVGMILALEADMRTLRELGRSQEEQIRKLEQNLPNVNPESTLPTYKAMIRRGEETVYSKFTLELQPDNSGTGVNRTWKFTVNNDVSLAAFHSAGADQSPPEHRLEVHYRNLTDFTEFRGYSAQISQTGISIKIDPGVVIKGPIVNGPTRSQSLVGVGRWYIA